MALLLRTVDAVDPVADLFDICAHESKPSSDEPFEKKNLIIV